MEYQYYLLFFFLLVIIIRFYVKITYKFWAYQPVFHYYNLFYWIYPIGIIDNELPKSNKYCNFINITTKDFFQYNDKEINQIIELIRNNYNRNSDANYLPNKDSFTQYFTRHTSKTYISTYNNPTYRINEKKNNDIIKDNDIIGVITGRPIKINFNNKEKINGYYVDFLCVNRQHRKKNIAPELIQTYEYSQRHNNKDSLVSLFKREGKLTGIVPLTIYKTYMFYTTPIKPEKDIKNLIIEISEVNFDLLTDFIDSNSYKFDCTITVCKPNLLNLILKNIYKVYGILSNNKLVSCYMFRANDMFYNEIKLKDKGEKIRESIDLVVSINNTDDNNFLNGFKIAVNKLSKFYINIENISNNNIIINNLLKSLKPKFIAPIAYFFYNYAKRPLSSDKVLLIV